MSGVQQMSISQALVELKLLKSRILKCNRGISDFLDSETRLVSFRGLYLSCFGRFQGLYTILKQTRDELVALYAIKFCRGKLFFIPPSEFTIYRIGLHRFCTLAVLDVYNVSTRLTLSLHKDTVHLLTMIAEMVHALSTSLRLLFSELSKRHYRYGYCSP
jgi:hypothetical protein